MSVTTLPMFSQRVQEFHCSGFRYTLIENNMIFLSSAHLGRLLLVRSTLRQVQNSMMLN